MNEFLIGKVLDSARLAGAWNWEDGSTGRAQFGLASLIDSKTVVCGVMPAATVTIVASSSTSLPVGSTADFVISSVMLAPPVTIKVLRVACIPVDCTLLLSATPFRRDRSV
jgi:hypothetical protein